MSLLRVKNLSITNQNFPLLENISFELEEGEVLGIIGESGSGKSLLCKTILGLTPEHLDTKGDILLENKEILNSSFIDKLRGKKVAIVLQEAINAFDPLYKIGYQMIESLEKKRRNKELCLNWLEKVGIKDCEKVFNSYPNELSGGQLQRVMIAIAIAQETSLIIADEPTSSLDVITQKQIIDIFKNLKDKTLIFVSHDLALISKLANKVLVLKEGKCMEYTQCKDIFNTPKNSYTKHLIKTRNELSQRFLSCLK